jgi:hypothetical protein
MEKRKAETDKETGAGGGGDGGGGGGDPSSKKMKKTTWKELVTDVDEAGKLKAVDSMATALRSSSSLTREGEEEILDTLIGLLTDPSSQVRKKATNSICHHNRLNLLSSEHVDRILDRLKVEDEDKVREAIIRAVDENGSINGSMEEKAVLVVVRNLFPQMQNLDGHFVPSNGHPGLPVFSFPETQTAALRALHNLDSFSPTVMNEMERFLIDTSCFQGLVHMLANSEGSSYTMRTSLDRWGPRGQLHLYFHI